MFLYKFYQKGGMLVSTYLLVYGFNILINGDYRITPCSLVAFTVAVRF